MEDEATECDISWTLEIWKIKDLKMYGKNPRYLKGVQADHLKTSIKKFGQCEPIVINQDGTIIGGHQRVRILKKMRRKKADIYYPSRLLSDKEVEELNIRLNKNVGEWDYDCLGNEWDVPDLIDWGFDPEEIGILLDDDEKKEKSDEGYKCPTCGKKSKKKIEA